jgi:hypothetical protein
VCVCGEVQAFLYLHSLCNGERDPASLAHCHLPYTEMAPRITQADHSGRYLMNTRAMSALIMMR